MNITYKSPESPFYEVTPEDELWWMSDGFKLVPRATIEIHPSCPNHLVTHIHHAIGRGYLKPVVYMPEKEYVWATLEK